MAKITFHGQAVNTAGTLPAIGSTAPEFKLTNGKLEDVSLASFGMKRKILSIVPSLDTPVCANSARHFNAEIAKLPQTVLLNISADLPFAQGRFCESHNLENITTLSTMRATSFGKDYGVQIVDGPLAGLMSRAVLVLDGQNKVVYAEQVPEIAEEPNYDKVLAALQSIAI